MSEPSPEQSFFSIHLKSLTDFADEFTTQIQSLQSPMDHLATMSGTAPQYGAFHEAWSLGAGEQAAVEEMFSLLGQVKTAIAFAGDVTGTVAEGYRNADENIAYGSRRPADRLRRQPGVRALVLRPPGRRPDQHRRAPPRPLPERPGEPARPRA